MPLNTDLLLRYVLSSDTFSLTEQVCVIPGYGLNGASLTDNPLRRFYWTVPPSFVSDCSGGFEGVRDVRIWRTRAYKLGADTFEEGIYHPNHNGWEKVTRNIRYVPDRLANNRILEMLAAYSSNRKLDEFANATTKNTHGGARRTRHYLKSDDELKEFALRVDEFRPFWTEIKNWFKQQDYDGGCVKAIQGLDWFRKISAQHGDIPESILRKVLSCKDGKGRKYWPYAFAPTFAVHVDLHPSRFQSLYVLRLVSDSPGQSSRFLRALWQAPVLLLPSRSAAPGSGPVPNSLCSASTNPALLPDTSTRHKSI